MLASGLVEGLGGHVEAVLGPDDGPALDLELGEAGRVAEGLKHAGPLLVAERNVADRPVFEQQPQAVVTDHGGPGHVYERWNLGHDWILGEWLDRFERLMVPGSVPVCEQLAAVQRGPFADETKRARRKGAAEDLAVDADRRRMVPVLRMEVGDRMIALVPLDLDHDPEEGADPRH
jgi:hypothetical protein